MLEVGIVYEREPVELLDGQLIAMPPEGPRHSSVVTALTELLVQRFAGRAMVRPGNPVELDDTSEPQPDLTLVHRHGDWYESGHPRPPEVFFVIEVSMSTLGYDRGQKLRAYARGGIAEVWIVNLVHRQVEVHTDPHELGYAGCVIVGRDGALAPGAFPDDVLPVAAFLP